MRQFLSPKRKSKGSNITRSGSFQNAKGTAKLDEGSDAARLGAEFDDHRVRGDIEQTTFKQAGQLSECTEVGGSLPELLRCPGNVVLATVASVSVSPQSYGPRLYALLYLRHILLFLNINSLGLGSKNGDAEQEQLTFNELRVAVVQNSPHGYLYNPHQCPCPSPILFS